MITEFTVLKGNMYFNGKIQSRFMMDKNFVFFIFIVFNNACYKFMSDHLIFLKIK